MHKRPRLAEAVELLHKLSSISADAKSAIEQYYDMREQNMHFQACRMVVDIVDHYYHSTSVAEVNNG